MKIKLYHLIILICIIFSGSYLAVPLYNLFCQSTGYGGTVKATDESVMPPTKLTNNKLIKVRLESTYDALLANAIEFKPQINEVTTRIGETSLVFYKITNTSDKDLLTVSTYNVTPNQFGRYFIKIECFCFDEQRFKPQETVELPVMFYIDPNITNDISCQNVNEITLSYTMFKTENLDN
jgi:cytochrome c oxidase assembly protein subunit 11